MRTRWLAACAACVLIATPLGAQQPDRNDAKAAAKYGFDEVHGWITRAADMVPADKYTYRPVATVRTFGELVAHVADAYVWYCGQASGKNTPWSDAIEKGRTDKATVVAKLKETHATCAAQYAGNGRIHNLFANVAHASLHYGNIITYMRMLALVPPSS